MKRRIQGLVSSTSQAAKKRSWREEQTKPDRGSSSGEDGPLPDSDDEVAERSRDSLAQGNAGGEGKRACGPNPVVWLELSVAGKRRGKVYFELFQDVAPRTSEAFRQMCVGIPEDPDLPDGPVIGHRGSELHRVQPGQVAEFERPVDSHELDVQPSSLEHSKAGLLTVVRGSPQKSNRQFQVTLSARPDLDQKQVVFGQLIAGDQAESSSRLPPLYWVESVGSHSGTPREAVMVENCGECSAAEAQAALGELSPDAESQAARYGRAGILHGKLEDALSEETVGDALEMTADILDSLQWDATKAQRANEGPDKVRRLKHVEASVKQLTRALEAAEHNAGDVHGFEGKLGRQAKNQLLQAQELIERVSKIY